ncbi:MAG: ECF transporter S component [Clostridia bacterium]|nr:ECF transporter S component [Clostridia bacterium]
MKRFGSKGSLTYKLTLYAVLTAIEIVLAVVNIPMPAGLSITFNMIPVAVAGIAMGPVGGMVMGGIFGLISFLQCFGLLGYSGMGAALVQISPVLTFVQRFGSRLLMGLIAALIYRLLSKKTNVYVSSAVTGFSSAFFNTLFFMGSLVLLFGSSDYMQNSMAGRGFFAYIVAAVGVNGLVEMIVATAVTGAVGAALRKARLI